MLWMKLLVDTRGQCVLFAEATKLLDADTGDFLFSLLAVPPSAVAKLLGPDAAAGSCGSIYRSTYALPGVGGRPCWLPPRRARGPGARAAAVLDPGGRGARGGDGDACASGIPRWRRRTTTLLDSRRCRRAC